MISPLEERKASFVLSKWVAGCVDVCWPRAKWRTRCRWRLAKRTHIIMASHDAVTLSFFLLPRIDSFIACVVFPIVLIMSLLVLTPSSDHHPLASRYLISHKIASGGFGEVYAGIRKKDGRPVALKVVPRKRMKEIQTADGKVPVEVVLLRRVSKVKHVIHLLDYFLHEECWVLVLERPEHCCDLYDFICQRSHGLDEPLARDFFKQIIQILQDVHQCGVLHRDIKDENFLVDTRTGELYLIDFGSGAVLHDGIYLDFEGTACYAAPEWVTCRRYFGLPQTVWSVGILLYDLVCGDIPFADELSIVKCQLHFPPHLSPECIQLIEQCLSIRSSERPTLEQCLQSDWLKSPSSRDFSFTRRPKPL